MIYSCNKVKVQDKQNWEQLLSGCRALALSKYCFIPDWLAGSIWQTGAKAPWGCRSQKMITRGIECMNWFVSLALNHPSFCPSHTHGYNCSCQPFFGVLMEATHSLACKSLQVLRTLQSLLSSDVYTELYNKGDITVFFSISWCVWSSQPCCGTGRGTSALLCRYVQGWLAGHSWAVPHPFPRFQDVLHLQPPSRRTCFCCCCQLRKVLLHLSLIQLRLDQIFWYR